MNFDDITREEALSYRLRINPRREYYHSTSSIYADRIKREGLCKRSVSGVSTIYIGEFSPELINGLIEDGIFISTSPNKAWAELVRQKVGGEATYFIVPGTNILKAGCKAYPDYGCLQPLDKRGRLISDYIKEIVLLDCDCVEVMDVKAFKHTD